MFQFAKGLKRGEITIKGIDSLQRAEMREGFKTFNRRFIATKLYKIFQYSYWPEVVNPSVVTSEMSGLKKIKDFLIIGFANYFYGVFNNLFPVGTERLPPFFFVTNDPSEGSLLMRYGAIPVHQE